MTFIRHHWFGLLTSVFIFAFVVLFILVLLSPRQDAKGRGFIPCTENMAVKMTDCMETRKYGCMLVAILQNSWCEFKVVGKGIVLWTQGEQSYPWSNYIFIPEKTDADDNFDAAARAEYLKTNKSFAAEMQELRKANEELENEQFIETDK